MGVMTVQQAVGHLENIKWLKGFDNTMVDGRPLPDIIDDIINLLEAQDEQVQREYESAVEMQQYCERYEPTYNPEDGSM